MKSKLQHEDLDCGSIGWQPVHTTFKDGKLVAMYFVWDREKIKNLVLDMDQFTKQDIEEENAKTPSRLSDEMWLSKRKAEDEMGEAG